MMKLLSKRKFQTKVKRIIQYTFLNKIKALEELASSIKISKNGDFLTFPTLRAIFDGLALYVSQTFCQLIDDYRTGN